MAIVEVQVREEVFLAMLEAELLRVPLPGSLTDSLAQLGQLLPGQEPLWVERVECT